MAEASLFSRKSLTILSLKKAVFPPLVSSHSRINPGTITLSIHAFTSGSIFASRGVPLAIAADDGALYFPADGNQRLKTLLNARVRASGTLVEKHEPTELKMPVGDKNQMVVRVEGGYKQITNRNA